MFLLLVVVMLVVPFILPKIFVVFDTCMSVFCVDWNAAVFWMINGAEIVKVSPPILWKELLIH